MNVLTDDDVVERKSIPLWITFLGAAFLIAGLLRSLAPLALDVGAWTGSLSQAQVKNLVGKLDSIPDAAVLMTAAGYIAVNRFVGLVAGRHPPRPDQMSR